MKYFQNMLFCRNIIFFVSFLLFTIICVGQQTDIKKEDILELTKKSERFLIDANFKESLFYAREALKLSISIDDDYLKSISYKIIASNYEELSEYDKSIDNYKKALAYAERLKDEELLSRINNNIGNIYFFQKNEYDRGFDYYNKSIYHGEQLKDTSRIAFANLNLAWAKFDIGRFDDGYKHLEYVNSNLRFLEEDAVAVVNMLNGMYNSNKGNVQKAANFFELGIKEADRLSQDVDLSYSYLEYSMFLNKYGMYKSAFENLNKYRELRAKIYDKKKLQKALSEGLHFEIDEYKRAIAQINQEKSDQASKLKRSRIIVYLFIAGVICLLIILWIVHKNYKDKKKLNAQLEIANREMRLAKDLAIEAAKVKTQFVSTISHELRTPLYGVIGITDMIMDEYKELKDSTHLKSLKFSAKYLLSLVNDILQINKIEENKLKLENHCFSLHDQLETVKESLNFVSKINNNTIVLEISEEIPEMLVGDRIRLCQVLINLISNALKFTSDDTVVLKVDLEKRIETTCHLHFQVIDNGIGVAEKDQEAIFDKFVQLERKNEDYQGTGLGLAIVRKLVNLFGSEIYIESKENVGSTFRFTIPFDCDTEKCNELINDIYVDLRATEPLKILVVEDNKINQIVTRKILSDKNHGCIIADSGYTALEFLSKDKFDAILMDINMPGMDGFETSREIRKRGLHLPIIALTAYGREEIIDRVLDSGMNDCLVKPFEASTLFSMIDELVK